MGVGGGRRWAVGGWAACVKPIALFSCFSRSSDVVGSGRTTAQAADQCCSACEHAFACRACRLLHPLVRPPFSWRLTGGMLRLRRLPNGLPASPAPLFLPPCLTIRLRLAWSGWCFRHPLVADFGARWAKLRLLSFKSVKSRFNPPSGARPRLAAGILLVRPRSDFRPPPIVNLLRGRLRTQT